MRYLVGHLIVGANIKWENLGKFQDEEEGIIITFSSFSRKTEREAQKFIHSVLTESDVNWLKLKKQNWIFSTEKFVNSFPDFNEPWLHGNLILDLEHDIKKEMVFGQEQDRTSVRFIITPELVSDQLPKRIFLSHKGIDKPQIRKYKSALEVIGLDPWLDEDAMVAGIEIERGLLSGFKQSCAAVFFITPNYVDDGYLATEINYAILEKRKKGDKFSIITLALTDEKGQTGKIPDLLQQYVWKTPQSELEAYSEIIRALPIQFHPPIWK